MRANSQVIWTPGRPGFWDTFRAPFRSQRGTLANDSILVTPGAGATVATHTVSSKEHQVFMEADHLGHLKGSRDGFVAWYTPVTNAAGREVAELFNADAGGAVVRVRGIWVVPTLTAITGVQIGFDVNRISAVGTTGSTAVTPRPLDKNAAVLDADITARYGSTAGATLDVLLWQCYFFNDETNPSAGFVGRINQVPVVADYACEVVLRQNQGVQVKQSVTATVGLTGALIYFVVE